MNMIETTQFAATPLFKSEYGHFIGGEWVEGNSGRTIPLRNPATGEVLSLIPAGDATDARRAVDAAAAAFPDWARSSPAQRQSILYEIAQRLRRRVRDFATFDTLNNGKPISEAIHFDMPMAIEQFEIFAGTPWSLSGESHSTATQLGIIHREPLGVCAQIIPWNVPMIMLASKLAPALAAGNTVVLKPSEIVCLSVLEFVEEMKDIIPPGVLNVINGYGPDLGEAIVTDPRVRKVAFTGSRPTARTLMRLAATNIIPQTMELGGKSANIVCEDADIAAAAEGAAMSTVLNKGEVCLSGSRIFVHDKVMDEFLEKFNRALDRVVIGDPMNPATTLGAQASQQQMDKVIGYLELGPKEGATLARGGHAAKIKGLADGFFIEPTIFTNVTNDMTIARDEVFGPVSMVLRWNDEADMLRQANDSVYGLGGGLWTKDIGRAHRISRALETGTVWVNRYYNFMGNMPIGGYKQSGFGREFSHEVLNHYTLTKSVIINLQDGPIGLFGDLNG
jgi:aldehyde dehydrogenase